MNSPRPDKHRADDDDAIEETAAAWLAWRDDGFTTAQAHEFECWRRADPRHAAAVVRVEQACARLEKLAGVPDELLGAVAEGTLTAAEDTNEASISAKRVSSAFPSLRWIGGMAAAVTFGGLAWWQWPATNPSSLRYATLSGGYERVALMDGSTLELNANSAAQVSFSARERRVTLTAGEAHFSVAHDAARPFIVAAGDVSVRAVGTAFNVRLGFAAVEVLVTEGKVRIDQTTGAPAVAAPSGDERDNRDRASTGPQPTFASANERVRIPARRGVETTSPPPPRIEKIEPPAIRQALAWQERKLVFAETPLHEVVAQFNRLNRVELVIGDAALAGRAVGGTFAADNVDGFVRLLESTGDIVVERRGDRQIVLRKTR